MEVMIRTRLWINIVWMRWIPALLISLWVLQAVESLDESHVCMEKQKYNVTKRIKYRAPMSVRTYEWCLAVPPRCSRWTTEMRDLTRLETEERIMEVAVCCPGYRMKGVTCHPRCPSGKTGHNCTERCPKGRWGPSCSRECTGCPEHASCSPYTGNCVCEDGWKGERCEKSTDEATTFQPASINVLTTPSLSTIQSTPLETSITSTKTTIHIIETTAITGNSEKKNIIMTTPTTTTMETPVTTASAETTRQQPPFTNQHQPPENTTNDDDNITKILTLSTKQEHSVTSTIKSKLWTTPDTPTSIITNSIAREDVPVSTTPIDIINFTKQTTPPLFSNASMVTNKETTKTTKLIKQVAGVNENKPKEIWIKPTKGDSILFQLKNKTAPMTVHKTIKVETTPRTIVVSIIPTSIDHTAMYKKITISLNEHRQNVKQVQNVSKQTLQNITTASSMWKIITATNPHVEALTKTQAQSAKYKPQNPTDIIASTLSTFYPLIIRNITTHPFKDNHSLTKEPQIITQPTTNKVYLPSANDTINLSSSLMTYSSILTTKALQLSNIDSLPTKMPPTVTVVKHSLTTLANRVFLNMTPKEIEKSTTLSNSPNLNYIKSKHHQPVQRNDTSTSKPVGATVGDVYSQIVKSTLKVNADTERVENSKTNSMGAISNLTTTNHSPATNNDPTNTEQKPVEDEVFHILTEPEQITAIMEGGSERNTDNLLSVLGIAGGVMFVTISVGVAIVMMERCRRTRFEGPMKTNEEMEAMDDDEEPPPYVRSIFHAPLPDPPSEKSHYQPISTLDRNLKQFMRPVTVQSISPIMMENFRGILECHYDHLPPRSSHISFRSDTLPSQFRSSLTPSTGYASERCSQQSDITDKTLPATELSIETLKHEVAVEVVDPSTAEPLYAEIPCWRPTSHQAFQIVNLNGEAVTEL